MCFLALITPGAQLLQVVIQASNEPREPLATAVPFDKEFHSSSAHCMKKHFLHFELAPAVSADGPFFFHWKR